MDYTNQNALKAIAKKCNNDMVSAGIRNDAEHRVITDKYAKQAKLLGFSKMQMMRCIGVMNGQLVER